MWEPDSRFGTRKWQLLLAYRNIFEVRARVGEEVCWALEIPGLANPHGPVRWVVQNNRGAF